MEVRLAEREVDEARKSVERMDATRKELEDQLFLLGREKLTVDKGAKYAQGVVDGIRAATQELESKLTEAQNQMSNTMQV